MRHTRNNVAVQYVYYTSPIGALARSRIFLGHVCTRCINRIVSAVFFVIVRYSVVWISSFADGILKSLKSAKIKSRILSRWGIIEKIASILSFIPRNVSHWIKETRGINFNDNRRLLGNEIRPFLLLNALITWNGSITCCLGNASSA